jgi:hypothetical protein
VASALLVLLLVGELVVRLFLPDLYDTERLAAMGSDLALGRYRQVSSDPALLYELKPKLDVKFGSSRAVTDEHGARIDPSPRPDPPGKPAQLVVLGDSTSFGWRVDWAQSYPALIAARLQQRAGRPVHLQNLSVPGYDSEQELRLLETRVLPAQPELVIWHVDHNDANDPYAHDGPVQISPQAGDNRLHSALLKLLLRRRLQGQLEAHIVDGYLDSGPQWERHVAALEQGVREARAAGIPLLLVLFDCNVFLGHDSLEHLARLHVPLLARLSAAGAQVLDLYPSLQAEISRQNWPDLRPLRVAPDDPHPGVAGHALLADLIGTAIDQRWPSWPGSH